MKLCNKWSEAGHKVWIWRKLCEVLLLINGNFSNNDRVEVVGDQMGRSPTCPHGPGNVRASAGLKHTASTCLGRRNGLLPASVCRLLHLPRRPVCSSVTTASSLLSKAASQVNFFTNHAESQFARSHDLRRPLGHCALVKDDPSAPSSQE